MGCGCGGRKNNRQSAVVPRPAGAVNARQVQVQPAQRQAASQPGGAAANFLGAKDEMEKRRRIQISLRKRQQG